MRGIRAATASEFRAQAAEADKPHDPRLAVSRRRLLAGGSIVAASLVGQSLVGSSVLGAARTELSVGKVDITPAAGAYLAGYGVDVPRLRARPAPVDPQSGAWPRPGVGEIRADGYPVAGPTTAHYREVTLPLDVTPTADNFRQVLASYTARSNNAGLPGYYRRHARQMISQIEAGTVATSIPVPVQSWRFTGSPDLRLLRTAPESVDVRRRFRQRLPGHRRRLDDRLRLVGPPQRKTDSRISRRSRATSHQRDRRGAGGVAATVASAVRGTHVRARRSPVRQRRRGGVRARIGQHV
ncbi:hypothetical protein ABZU25_34335, partial [Micromonospora sp. NPDC005215]|uniref:hypothetical protein n=1 Tax=Micromonospora sp. NPDC005215 TaxID=3157024 RepID=UPI0033A76D05